MSFKNIEGQSAWCMEELLQSDMSVVHRAGKLHANADALSHISHIIMYRQDHDQVAKCGAKMVKNEVDKREMKMNSTKQTTS